MFPSNCCRKSSWEHIQRYCQHHEVVLQNSFFFVFFFSPYAQFGAKKVKYKPAKLPGDLFQSSSQLPLTLVELLKAYNGSVQTPDRSWSGYRDVKQNMTCVPVRWGRPHGFSGPQTSPAGAVKRTCCQNSEELILGRNELCRFGFLKFVTQDVAENKLTGFSTRRQKPRPT